jgi:LmbE family N-acetylglucosaminyl deacetylase
VAVRRAELRAACDVLGVSELVCGGHPDGALASVDADTVIGEMVGMLRRERPDVVVTFGPEGAPTGHRDHKAISRLATSAFLLSGVATAFPEQLSTGLLLHRPARLCYVTWPLPAPGTELATEGQPIDIRVPVRDCLGRKIAAFEMHRTQHAHRASFDRLALTETEYFFVASGAPVVDGADDLFAALP